MYFSTKNHQKCINSLIYALKICIESPKHLYKYDLIIKNN